MIDLSHWIELAVAAARAAHENNFESRRGCYRIEDDPEDPIGVSVLCIYDNNPYDSWPGLREGQLDELCSWCEAQGIHVLARAAWPGSGEQDAGYTRSALLATSEDQDDMVQRRWRQILAATESDGEHATLVASADVLDPVVAGRVNARGGRA